MNRDIERKRQIEDLILKLAWKCSMFYAMKYKTILTPGFMD